jgi:hypothetical protein
MNSRPTQEDRILHLLQAAWPNWTPAPELSRISLGYGRCVHSLRRKGWLIVNRVEVRDGVRHGFFRLGPVPLPVNRERRQQKAAADALIDPATKSETKTDAKPNLVDYPDALFGDFSPSRYPD